MTPRLVHHCVVAAGVAVLAGVAGCGGPYDATLTGVVTLDGNVLPRGTVGTVAFHPVSGGPAAHARIHDDGTYIARTGREVGLPLGEYEISVTANEPPEVARTPGGGPPPPGKPITPEWYGSKETSGLRYTVERGRNRFDLELSSQPPPGWNPRRR